jgi:aspartate racemase
MRRRARPQREALAALARTLIARDGAEAIVLAGTELALVLNEENAGFPAVDCARLHLDAILRRMMPAAL